MPASRRFPATVAAAVARSQIIGVRAGGGDHRVIGIWAVVVGGRVFVRSWSLEPRSWYRTFLEDPTGLMTVGTRRFRVRAVPTRGERMNDAVSQAYLEKYCTPASLKYARDLGRRKSRATTTELVPAGPAAPSVRPAGARSSVASKRAIRRSAR